MIGIVICLIHKVNST